MQLDLLKDEIASLNIAGKCQRNYLKFLGYNEHLSEPIQLCRAYAVEALFTRGKKHIYTNDLIAGSLMGLFSNDISEEALENANRVISSFGERNFTTNADHFAPDYKGLLELGVGGIIEKIDRSEAKLAVNMFDYNQKKLFLQAARIAMKAFSAMIAQYSTAALYAAESAEPHLRINLMEVAKVCNAVSQNKPTSFREALQLVWFAHTSFVYEGRYAMALGRIDQYLYPFYKNDIDSGVLSRGQAVDLVSGALYKIAENRKLFGGDDVVNICIGGLNSNGIDATNELSYVLLDAVKYCNIPGPNLSARISSKSTDKFLDACLEVIGTGLGYPALMNDEVNIPALERMGYAPEDCRNYAMVGCIENFIVGKQPPWSDGRFNVPKYLELTLNLEAITSLETMEQFMDTFLEQLRYGADEYFNSFYTGNTSLDPKNYISPFLSCFCADCIDRAMDINDGGAIYPSVHGAACIGIGSVADSLAAIEWAVFDKKLVTINELLQALKSNFVGFEALRAKLLSLPKYGNNDDYVDKYACWYVDAISSLFDKYRTYDGGRVYIGIASNVQNISAGAEVAALPDGRKAGMPLSDAASPMYGQDKNGSTSVINSISKPNYKLVACGSVLNQKFSPSMFKEQSKRACLNALIRTYFKQGGQEMQINSVSRDILKAALENPEYYSSLVVRVSGFSAYYTAMDKSVQLDILNRTEHS